MSKEKLKIGQDIYFKGEKLPNEIWKPIKGYEGYYEASNLGNIKSLPRNGTIKTEKTLKGGIDLGGYKIHNLAKSGKYSTKLSHRLIAISFIPNPNNLLEVNHINGVKTDNRVENLEWCTREENMKHAFEKGLNSSNFKDLKLFGKDNPNAKKIICIHQEGTEIEYDSLTDASKKELVSITSIANNLKGLSKYCRTKLKFKYA